MTLPLSQLSQREAELAVACSPHLNRVTCRLSKGDFFRKTRTRGCARTCWVCGGGVDRSGRKPLCWRRLVQCSVTT